MFTALVWIGALAAGLAFMVCTVVAIVGAAAHNWAWLALSAPAALLALWLVFAAIRYDQRARRKRKLERLQAWTGTEITVPMHWLKWTLGMGMFAALTAVGVGTACSDVRGGLGIGLFFAVLFGYVVLNGLLIARAAVRAGYYLRVDPLGIHYCRLPAIPWRDVAALRMDSHTIKASTIYSLAVVLQPAAVRAWSPPPMLRFLDRAGRLRSGNKVQIGFDAAAFDPDLLLHAARKIGTRAGVPTLDGWPGSTDLALSMQLWKSRPASTRKAAVNGRPA
jgi:hypothetical protein